MKRKIILIMAITISFAAAAIITSCDNLGTVNQFLKEGKVYFQSKNGSARSARSVGGEEIEFLVTRLVLKDDTREGGVWVVGGNEGGVIGWYDIDSIRKANFGNQPQGRPHSCMFLNFHGIRIGDKLYAPSYVGAADMITFSGNKEDITTSGCGFGIIAGDKAKLGPGVLAVENEKEISFQGVNGMQRIGEFIILVDESVLLTNGDLSNNWWECFSFIVR